MNWFFVALSCAVFQACSDTVSKHIMAENDEWVTGTVLLGWAAIALSPILVLDEFRPFTQDFGLLLAITMPLEILSYYLFLSAIRLAPLSLSMPMLAFTPPFTILTAALVLGEQVTMTGACGIALVAVGAYLLNADLIHDHVLAPIRALVTNVGARRMLLVALIWSMTSTLGKKGIILYGALPFALFLLCLDVVIFGVVSMIRCRRGVARIHLGGGMRSWGLFGGVLVAAAATTHVVAMSLAPVAYMISVKRLSLVFSVLLGWIFFGEANIRFRFLGASVMVAGVFLIAG